jgi:hypothetical protein
LNGSKNKVKPAILQASLFKNISTINILNPYAFTIHFSREEQLPQGFLLV